MSLRFWYGVESVAHEVRFAPALAALEVDPGEVGVRALRDGLQPWAEQRLRERRCDFGLYVADFSAWTEEDAQDSYVRALYIVWSGDGPICVHVDDNCRAVRQFESTLVRP